MDCTTHAVTYGDDECWFGEYKESDLLGIGQVINGVEVYAITPDGKYYVSLPFAEKPFLVEIKDRYYVNPEHFNCQQYCYFYEVGT